VTALRRGVLLLALAVATVLGLTVTPAQAAFSAKAELPTATVSAITVAAPTGVSTAGTYCSTSYSYWNGTWYSSRTLHAKLSWQPSATTRGVTGYRVTAWFADGSSLPIADVSAATTSISQDVDGSYAGQGVRVTITTLTSYGWTTQSDKSGAITC